MEREELSDRDYEALGVMPMSRFPKCNRDRINAQAKLSDPPQRWLRIECGEIPSRGWFEWHIRRGRDPRKSRSRTPQALRRIIAERDAMTCKLCGKPIESTDLHIDHIVPVKHGGKTIVSNLQATHSKCNLKKGASLK